MRRMILLSAAWGLAMWAAPAWAQNLLQNPGFEDLEGAKPTSWVLNGGASVIDDPRIAHSGRRCARARFDEGVGQQVAIEGGAAYRISGWIRRVQPGGAEVPKIKVYFSDADGRRADVQAAEFEDVTADQWRRWQTVVQAPLNARALNLTLRAFFGGSEWFYYDDLTIEHVEALSWPAIEMTPNLHQLTVTVPDIAEICTDALLRLPPASLTPADGRLDSAVLTRGQDIQVQLERPALVCWALVHSMRPEMNLGEADLAALEGVTPGANGRRLLTPVPRSASVSERPTRVAPIREKLLAKSKPKQELVTSLRFEPTRVLEFALQIPAKPEVLINEIQLLGLSDGAGLPGQRVELPIAKADPPARVAQELAKAFPVAEHRVSAVASAGAAAGTVVARQLTLPADRYLNVFAAPREHEYGLAGFTVDLALPGADQRDLIELTLRRPEELDVDIRWTTNTDRGVSPDGGRRNYATVVRAVSRVESGRLSTTFDVPDLVCARGEPIWLTLRPRKNMTLDLARSRLTLHVLEPRRAYREYLPQLERLMRRMYSDASEAHAYDGRDWSQMVLGRYVRRVLEIDPQNQPAKWICRRIAKVRENVVLERPGPADAPDWAVWTRAALRNQHEIITWWLDNRQRANGELAGHINDDGEFSCNWPNQYLMTGDERIADGLRKLADVAWRMSAETGYTVGSRDVEHAAEDQSCTQPQVLLVDYGSPKALERFMVMSRYLDFWTAINQVGRRQFKSYMFTTKQIWDDPPFDVDHPYCPLAMVGTGHLLWYTHSPKAANIFFQEAQSWAHGCLSTDGGKPEGQIPMEIRSRDSRVNPYAPYPTNPILEKRDSLYRGGAGAYIVEYFIRGAHTLTGDNLYDRVLKLWTPSDEQKVGKAQAMLKLFNEPAAPAEGAWRPSQNETTLYDAWRATGDRQWLVEELKEVVRQQIRNKWLLTDAEPYTDRIPVPGRELLSRMLLGDWTSGKSHVPGHWVSWEGGGLDFAALVLDAKPDHLKTLVYSFHDRQRPMKMRLWRMPHGRYQVAVGVDRDGDDKPDEQLRRQEIELCRYDGAVEFAARPKQTLVIELTLLQQLDDVRTRPDLAIGPDDVAVSDGAATVTVHNIGGSASPPGSVQVRAADDKVLGVAQAPALPPPHDLQPVMAQVRIPLRGSEKPARVLLDPDNQIAEVTEANNQAHVRAR